MSIASQDSLSDTPSLRSAANFQGARVVAFETRRAVDMETLIARYGGAATLVPSMREVPLQSSSIFQLFARALDAGDLDLMIWMTGVGTRMLARLLDEERPHEQWIASMREVTHVARGPKPQPVLNELGLRCHIAVPSPNTWREILATLDAYLDDQSTLRWKNVRIAIQDFPTLSPEFLDVMQSRGAQVLRVPVYRYGLPADCTLLRQAVYRIVAGSFDVALFTTGVQMWHLLRIAAQLGLEADLRAAMSRMMIASVGPTTSEMLRECGFEVDVEPTHPKMGQLVKQAALDCSRVLESKRTRV